MDEDERNRIISEYTARLAAGEPVMFFAMREIVRFWVSPTGEALMDFAYGAAPDGQAVIARIAISSEAVQTSKV